MFWIDSLFLAILVFILSKSFRKKKGLACLLLSIIFLLTQLIVPGGWFYRYVSYIYLIPILFLVVSEWNINEKIVFLRNISYSLLLLNCIVALTCTLGIAILNNQVEDYYIKCINASDKPCYKSKLFGFVRKIDQNKRCLIVKDEDIENIPFLSTQSIIGIKYENLNRNVETTWLQDILIKKGIIK